MRLRMIVPAMMLSAACTSWAAGQVIPGQQDPLEALRKILGTGGNPAGESESRKSRPEKAAREPESKGFTLKSGQRLDFSARDLPVVNALQDLRVLLRKNIVVTPGVNARFTGDLYNVTMEEVLDVICKTTGLVYRNEGAWIYVEPARLETRVFHLCYASAKDVKALIEPLLSEQGKVSASAVAEKGIKADEEVTGGNDYAASEILVVRDVEENLRQVEEAVKHLDARPHQVQIEATILTASLTDSFSLGVDGFGLLGTDFRSLASESTGGTSLTLGKLPASQLDDTTGSFGTRMLQAFSAEGMRFGFIKNNVALFVKALQEVTDVTVLANPKLLVLNKQRGQVIVGRRDGYITSTTTQTVTVESVEFLETGTKLVFRPFIGEDGYVRLEVHPEDSDGGLTANGLPFKDTAEVTTNILLRSGETAVIAGLFRERVLEIEKKVPFLGDIPFLGLLFRSKQDLVRREEIIILLTPRILDDAEMQPPGTSGGKSPGPHPETGRRLARAYVESALDLVSVNAVHSARALYEAAESCCPDLEELETVRGVLDTKGTLPWVSDQQVDDRILMKTILMKTTLAKPARMKPEHMMSSRGPAPGGRKTGK